MQKYEQKIADGDFTIPQPPQPLKEWQQPSQPKQQQPEEEIITELQKAFKGFIKSYDIKIKEPEYEELNEQMESTRLATEKKLKTLKKG